MNHEATECSALALEHLERDARRNGYFEAAVFYQELRVAIEQRGLDGTFSFEFAPSGRDTTVQSIGKGHQ